MLDLSNNDLTAVPEALWNITSLRTLNLSNNNIVELPPELLKLKNLATLQLAGNPQLEVAAQIGEEKGAPGIFEYLRDLHDDPQPSFSIKLLMVGASMAGKSSIIDLVRLIHVF